MPQEMIVALRIIFGLFLLMIARNISKGKKENKGGMPMKHKHFNGRFFW